MNTPITAETRLCDLLDYANELAQSKADYTDKAARFQFLPDGALTNVPEQTGLWAAASMSPVKLTEHALKQAFAKLGKAYNLNSLGSDHMQALAQIDPDLFAMNMNRAISRLDPKEGWTVRTYQDTGRAVLSDGYLIIDNPEMLNMLNEVLTSDSTPHVISPRSFVSVDNMSVDILFQDINTGKGGGNDIFSLGVRIRNGETGNWKGGVYPIIKRHSCWNSVSTDDRASSFEFRHAGKNTLAAKRVMLRAAIGEILPFSVNLVDALIEAEEKELPKFGDIVSGLAIKHGWSESFKNTVFAGSEAKESVAGLVHGISYAAHKATETPEARVEAEFLAGSFINASYSVFDEAEAISRTRAAREAKAAEREARRIEREAARRNR